MSCLHPVFNVIKLTATPSNPIPGCHASPPLPLPELIDSEEEFEVEQILNSRNFRRRLEYLVCWKGYGVEENQWIPACDAVNAPELIAEFYCCNPATLQQI